MALTTLVTGELIGVYSLPAFTDKKTGEMGKARYRIQLLSRGHTKQGEPRCEFHEVGVPNTTFFKPHLGAVISVPASQWNMEGRSGLKCSDDLQPSEIIIKTPAIQPVQPALKAASA